jgi:hypothetical protein
MQILIKWLHYLEAPSHGRSAQENHSPYHPGSRSVRERDQSSPVLFEGMPPMTYRPPIRPHLSKFPKSPNIIKPLTHGNLKEYSH